MDLGDSRQLHMTALAAQIVACERCEGLNIPGKTQAAPGYGSVRSPVAIVGQSLCRQCMKSQVPFTGGSGRFLDAAFNLAGIAKKQVFITNVVHCHPPDNRPSHSHEIENCSPYLHRELEIVDPRLIIGLGRDAKGTLRSAYPAAKELPWPFTGAPGSGTQRTTSADLDLLFPPHPSWIMRQPRDSRDQYVANLVNALKWGFRDRPHAKG
nr:glycosylase [Mycobacterium marinum DL240490]